jgi:transposase InsO family protein
MIDITRYKTLNDGYAWILTIIDAYSKFAWAFSIKNKSGAKVVKNLKFLFYNLTEPPTILQSDNGKEFCNSLMNELVEEFKITFKHSRPRHPQEKGQIERFNQTLTRTLQKHVFDENSKIKKIVLKTKRNG